MKSLIDNAQRMHFIGIGGAGMSALAKVLAERGYQVSGSDLSPSTATEALEGLGATIHIGHRAEQVQGTDLVVFSSAIPEDNPERQRAIELGIPTIKRAELLGMLSRQERTVAVAGTHGKTTTSAMIAYLLEAAGLRPTFLVGGEILGLNTNARGGDGTLLVTEADEYDSSFLTLAPYIAIITNIEADHLDYYGSFDTICDAFGRFARLVPSDGYLIGCSEDPIVRDLLAGRESGAVSFGWNDGADWRAVEIELYRLGGSRFDAVYRGRKMGTVSLRVPGRHNIFNALGAVATATVLGVPWPQIRDGLSSFPGVARRLQMIGTPCGVRIFDDYAHHPTEIKATIAAARSFEPTRLWCLFQPHTYHRVEAFYTGFAEALGAADETIVTAVYSPPGRETRQGTVDSRKIVEAMNGSPDVIGGSRTHYIPDLRDAARFACTKLQPGDILLTMGAGDSYKAAAYALHILELREVRKRK